jgi:hypothetical protein
MLWPASGNSALKRLRLAVRAAMALAANVGKPSIMYVWMEMKMPIMLT